MKSMMRRPSENLPEGKPKYVSPLGGFVGPNAAEKAPVSEFESPRLNTAGKLQGEGVTDTKNNGSIAGRS